MLEVSFTEHLEAMSQFESLLTGLNDEVRKTPTLRKWLSESPKLNSSATYVIQQVWMPGKFDNISFLCENFKVHIYPNNPVFKDLVSAVSEWSQTSICICVKVTDPDTAEFDIVANSNEACDWEESTLGYRIKLREKKPGSTNLGTKRKGKQLNIPAAAAAQEEQTES